MIKTIVLSVDADTVNSIQRLNVETESRRDIIAFMLSSGMNIDNESFLRYQAEYQNFYRDFETSKTVFEKSFVKTQYPNATSWSLDYQTNEVTINYEA